MKLRYYLRGLGIGMLVAALILILSGNTGGRMSDEAVKNRAAQLGMVEKDKSVLEEIGSEGASADETEADGQPSLSDDAEKDKTDNASPDEEPEQTELSGPAGEDAQGMEQKNDGTASDEQEAGEEPLQSEEQALADEIEQRAGDVADRAKEVAEDSIPEKILTFEVYQGDTSISVARRAKEMGLVESAADFDVFLCQNGYDKRISIGSYEITVGATEKEIADIVTKSR